MNNEERVDSWAALNEALFRDSFDPDLQRFRSSHAFRGVADESWDLKTSLMRLGGKYDELERPILRSFRKYAHKNEAANGSDWSCLTVAQHHGLPTRLLDWTYSPYVALHFATSGFTHMLTDGVIWCVDFVKAKEYLPQTLQDALELKAAKGFTVEMLEGVAKGLDQFEKLEAKSDFVVFFEPPSLDERVVNQYGLFSVMSRSQCELRQWLRERPELYRRVIISSKLKWEIRDKLDQANINERMLFPGLDGLCQWLKRHYSPGPNAEKSDAQAAGK